MGNPIKQKIKITIELGSGTIEGAGATVLDALLSMKRPEKLSGKAILTATDGVKTTRQLMFPVRLKRLFYNKNSLAIQAKNFERAMK